ncbi:hypothetical protein EB822_02805 [Flavobacteriaceae bacterium PRS1]|jgi:hypothetical protein|nr:hypothetical protein EB822_02805 [Flavobacteriaceae bacterium PRS1]
MITHKLSFGEITLLQEDIAEVIVNDRVEFNLEMVAEYHEFLINKMKCLFSLLINKLNSYTYTFEAQQHLATLTDINAMAVVSYSNITELTTKSLIQVPREINWKIKIFNEREVALQWLQDQQQLRLME